MTTKTFTVRGDYMDDGYLRGSYSPRRLRVAVGHDKAWDVDDNGYRESVLRIDSEGRLVGAEWGAGLSFAPDDGELERIGLIRRGDR